jgi:hypothetical protein
MNYTAFYKAWDAALRTAGLLTSADRTEDSVELATMARKHSILVGVFHNQRNELFTTSMELSWQWDALLSARMRTTEQDVLTELLGRQGAAPAETEQPWLRVDIKLHGKLEWGKPLPLASSETWRAWVAEVTSQVDPLLPPAAYDEPGSEGSIRSWLGEPEAQLRVGHAGELWLLGVQLRAWQAIVLPRHFDDPDCMEDEDPRVQLDAMVARWVTALAAWKKSLMMLVPRGTLLH